MRSGRRRASGVTSPRARTNSTAASPRLNEDSSGASRSRIGPPPPPGPSDHREVHLRRVASSRAIAETPVAMRPHRSLASLVHWGASPRHPSRAVAPPVTPGDASLAGRRALRAAGALLRPLARALRAKPAGAGLRLRRAGRGKPRVGPPAPRRRRVPPTRCNHAQSARASAGCRPPGATAPHTRVLAVAKFARAR